MSGDSQYYTVQMSRNFSIEPWCHAARRISPGILETEEFVDRPADSDESELSDAQK
jgi:hypothetical protein